MHDTSGIIGRTPLTENSYLNPLDLEPRRAEWLKGRPYHHLIFDGFLRDDVARKVADEFPDYEDEGWYSYKNPLEDKKALNDYDKFGPATYRLIHFLYSRTFIDELQRLAGIPLWADIGLNGGGLHAHSSGGRLNPHLDYSIHPKLGLQRKLNLILYLTPGWDPRWGGGLGFWEHDPAKNGPGELQRTVDCLFNRAVLFDTTQNSWHGLPDGVTCPAGTQRRSLALYYMCEPQPDAPARGKALYAPQKGQENDPEVLAIIKKRSSVTQAQDVYRK